MHCWFKVTELHKWRVPPMLRCVCFSECHYQIECELGLFRWFCLFGHTMTMQAVLIHCFFSGRLDSCTQNVHVCGMWMYLKMFEGGVLLWFIQISFHYFRVWHGKEPSNEHLKFLREQLYSLRLEQLQPDVQAKPRLNAIPFDEILDWTSSPEWKLEDHSNWKYKNV